MVQRRAGDVDVAVLGLHAEQHQEHRVERAALVGIEVGEPRFTPFGLPVVPDV